MNRKIKSVSFNLDDPFEYEIYQQTLKFNNFSSYVKRLIDRSVNTIQVNEKVAPKVVQQSQNKQMVIKKEFIQQII